MVLIKPFFQGGSLAREREKERASEALHPSTQSCTLYIFKKPGAQQESDHKDPRHHPPPLDKEASRRPGVRAGLLMALFPGILPLGEFPFSIQHCLRTTVASSSSPDPHLHPSPEGHHRESAIMVRAEGTGRRWGGALDKDPLVPKARWQEARAKPLHSLPMVPGCQAVWVEGGDLILAAPFPYTPSPHPQVLLLHQATRKVSAPTTLSSPGALLPTWMPGPDTSSQWPQHQPEPAKALMHKLKTVPHIHTHTQPCQRNHHDSCHQ